MFGYRLPSLAPLFFLPYAAFLAQSNSSPNRHPKSISFHKSFPNPIIIIPFPHITSTTNPNSFHNSPWKLTHLNLTYPSLLIPSSFSPSLPPPLPPLLHSISFHFYPHPLLVIVQHFTGTPHVLVHLTLPIPSVLACLLPGNFSPLPPPPPTTSLYPCPTLSPWQHHQPIKSGFTRKRLHLSHHLLHSLDPSCCIHPSPKSICPQMHCYPHDPLPSLFNCSTWDFINLPISLSVAFDSLT